MNTEQVAKKVVELVRKQAWYEALDSLYDKDVVSVEATAPEAHGTKAVRDKVDWWVNAIEVHSFKAGEPFVANDRFVVQYDADVTEKNRKRDAKCPKSALTGLRTERLCGRNFSRVLRPTKIVSARR
jgi:hypothetical protein